MSNVWIVFAFKRRFCRRCKKQKKTQIRYCRFYIHYKIFTAFCFWEYVGLDITSWQPLPAGRARAERVGWSSNRLLARMRKKIRRAWNRRDRIGVIKAVLLPPEAFSLNWEVYSRSFRCISVEYWAEKIWKRQCVVLKLVLGERNLKPRPQRTILVHPLRFVSNFQRASPSF